MQNNGWQHSPLTQIQHQPWLCPLPVHGNILAQEKWKFLVFFLLFLLYWITFLAKEEAAVKVEIFTHSIWKVKINVKTPHSWFVIKICWHLVWISWLNCFDYKSKAKFFFIYSLIYFMVIKMCFIINMESDNTMLINKCDVPNFFNRFQFLKGIVCLQDCQS